MEPKTERNKLIVEQIESGKSFQSVADMFGLKAKSTVHSIYERFRDKDKKRVRSYPQPPLARRS